MKKLVFLVASALAIVLAFVAVSRHRSLEGSRTAPVPVDPGKQRIKDFWARYNQASAFRLQGNFTSAVAAYEDCLRVDPSHEDSLYYLGTSLEELGNYRAAEATFRRLLKMNPASGRALAELGETLSLRAPGASVDFKHAREAYQNYVQINREQAGPFLHLGLLDLDEQRLDAAMEHFRIAAAFGAPEGHYLLGYTLFLQKRYEEAARAFRKVIDVYARDRKITGRGVLSEGDILPAPGKPLTPLERAGLKSILFLYWVAHRSGVPPGGTATMPKEFHVGDRPESGVGFRPASAPVGIRTLDGRTAWTEFDREGLALVAGTGLGQTLSLYQARGGRLIDVTHAAGLEGIKNVWDASWTDYNHDGILDLYLIRPGFVGSGQNLLLRQDKSGKFVDVTAAAGLLGRRSTARVCFADFDSDGRQDLVEVGAADADNPAVRFFRNTGERFVDKTRDAGLLSDHTAADCATADYDHDGKPDLFILFWRRQAILYRNLGGGKFREVTEQAGLGGIRGQGFSALFFDYDRDSYPDLLITSHAPYEEAVRSLLQSSYKTVRNTPRLFRNNRHGFEEVTSAVGLTRSYGTMQAIAADIDSDGWIDLVLANGGLDCQRLEPSVILRNIEGREFREWSYLPSFSEPANFIGASVADLNRDGAPDLFLARNSAFRTAPRIGGLFLNSSRPAGRRTPPSPSSVQSRPAQRE